MSAVPADPTASTARRALIVGGALGGLFAGALLKRRGWNVDIYERSSRDLDSRGGGIVLQPEVVEAFQRAGADIEAMDLGVPSRERKVFRRDGSLQDRRLAPQTQTSWSLIYTTMKRAFGEAHYHQGKTLTALRQEEPGRRVTAKLESGSARPSPMAFR